MGQLIVNGQASLQKAHQHSGYLTVAVTLIYIGWSWRSSLLARTQCYQIRLALIWNLGSCNREFCSDDQSTTKIGLTVPSVVKMADEEPGTGLVSEERAGCGRRETAIDDIGLVSPPAHRTANARSEVTARDRSETVKIRQSTALRFRVGSQETQHGSQPRRPARACVNASPALDLESPAIRRVRQAGQSDGQHLCGAAPLRFGEEARRGDPPSARPRCPAGATVASSILCPMRSLRPR